MTTGSCPDCGGRMEKAEFVETWDLRSGKPKMKQRDYVCRRCGIRWTPFNLANENEVDA